MKLSADDSVRYFTKIDDTIAGPYTFEGLESLVYLKRVTPDTLVRREGADAFAPVRQSELGPRLFKSLIPARGPREWAPPGKEHHPDFSNRTRLHLGEAKFERVNTKHPQQRKIDVLDLLDDIRQTEIESGRDHVRPTRFRIAKRTRDFWLMLVAGNTIFLGTAIYMQNTASIVFGIAGCGLYTFGLLWSMYGVMDKY